MFTDDDFEQQQMALEEALRRVDELTVERDELLRVIHEWSIKGVANG